MSAIGNTTTITANCSQNISFGSPSQLPVPNTEQFANNSLSYICNEFNLLLNEDQRIYIQVKNTNAIAFTFIACAFLLFFYSCCWFNRFHWFNICGDAAASEATLIEDLAATTSSSTVGIVTATSGRDQGCIRSYRCSIPVTTIDGFCAINIDQTQSPEMPDLGRREDMDLESLPSYTICSGLPTYDDALDQFRKYGIILQPPTCIKIFEEHKDKDKDKDKDKLPNNLSGTGAGDNDDAVSVTSTCTCGGGGGGGGGGGLGFIGGGGVGVPNVIELSPEHLQMLSQKRLSLQIAVNNGMNPAYPALPMPLPPSRRSSRVNLYREVSRNNLLRNLEIPTIHRSASQHSLYQDQMLAQRFKNSKHRGSLY